MINTSRALVIISTRADAQNSGHVYQVMSKICDIIKCCVFMVICDVSGIASGLEWKQTELELNADAGNAMVSGVFYFENTSARPVRIVSASTSCSCMKATFPEQPIVPGGKGELRVDVSLDRRVGKLFGLADVKTDELVPNAQTLKLAVILPEPINIQPRRLVWQRNSTEDYKEVIIKLSGRKKASLDAVTCVNKNFLPQISLGREDGVYKILVKAVDTSMPAASIIKVLVTVDDVKEEYLLYSVVR